MSDPLASSGAEQPDPEQYSGPPGPGGRSWSRVVGWLFRPETGWVWLVVTLGYATMAVLATHKPPSDHWVPQAPPFPHADKVVHAAMYFGLAALVACSLAAWGGWDRPKAAIGTATLLWLSLGVYAAIDELTQPWVGRTADLLDWLADMGGVTLALWLGWLIFPFLRRPAAMVAQGQSV